MKTRLLSLSLLLLSAFSPAFSQKVYELKDCINIGLEKNYSLLISRNSETIAKNNHTIGNAGYLPTLGLTGRSGGSLNDVRTDVGDTSATLTKGIFNTSNTAALTMGLTIFDGFSVTTTYKKLGELKKVGELNTQMSIENLIADIASAYYKYIQQVKLLQNLEYAVSLSKDGTGSMKKGIFWDPAQNSRFYNQRFT